MQWVRPLPTRETGKKLKSESPLIKLSWTLEKEPAKERKRTAGREGWEGRGGRVADSGRPAAGLEQGPRV